MLLLAGCKVSSMRYQTNVNRTTLHRCLAVALSLLGAWACKNSFQVGITKPAGGLDAGRSAR
jgi:hypothetical protein